MSERLNADDREIALATLSDWADVAGRDAIAKTFKFRDFKAAFAFMTACALKAEQMDHHPEWSNVYSSVSVVLSTHDKGGVTNRDIDLAAFMNEAAG